MSLDFYLIMEGVEKERHTGIWIREDGSLREISREEWDSKFPGVEPITATIDDNDVVFSRNITHNLNTMAQRADVYKWLWQPENVGATHARHMIEPLREGLRKLRGNPKYFKSFNPPNGWGNYINLVDFVEACLKACEEYPDAKVEVLV